MTVIYLCKMIISSGILKILIFWVHRVVKGRKMVWYDKKLFLWCSISQEPLYHMIVICGANVWNDNISRCFFNVKILIFQVVKGLKGQKMAQNVENFCRTLHFRNHTAYDLHLWYTCVYKRIISPSIFFHFFQNFDFFDH